MQGAKATNMPAFACSSKLSYVEYISFQLFRFFDNTAPLTCAAQGVVRSIRLICNTRKNS